ncbi:hypothetical protein FGO68_gene13300 [Halteria grandinella]|uniref:Uncharacterized protein n=1 Tax=Halteria grandinella TaxID=5974 RepID=A0A8J8NGD8_HALGN|nr:hypothetical protein FGO68_gene13300 [Halteria grandinella]
MAFGSLSSMLSNSVRIRILIYQLQFNILFVYNQKQIGRETQYLPTTPEYYIIPIWLTYSKNLTPRAVTRATKTRAAPKTR